MFLCSRPGVPGFAVDYFNNDFEDSMLLSVSAGLTAVAVPERFMTAGIMEMVWEYFLFSEEYEAASINKPGLLKDKFARAAAVPASAPPPSASWATPAAQ